jgi:uncharacterized protein (DUF1778 family)
VSRSRQTNQASRAKTPSNDLTELMENVEPDASITLKADEIARFVAALLTPTAPTPRLKRLMEAQNED